MTLSSLYVDDLLISRDIISELQLVKVGFYKRLKSRGFLGLQMTNIRHKHTLLFQQNREFERDLE